MYEHGVCPMYYEKHYPLNNITMKVKIKKLNEAAVLPKYAKDGDAGMDLTATSKKFDPATGCIIYGTGLAMEIPKGYVGYLFPRSSIYKKYQYQTNAVGVIDAGYRGEIKVIMRASIQHVRPANVWDRVRSIFCRRSFSNISDANVIIDHINNEGYEVGERIAQIVIMPRPVVEWVEADELSDSERGTGGHGSTGK